MAELTTAGALPVLEARGVSKSFPGVKALSDVSITVRAGEVHALVGENGAGKSTLIKILTGVYQCDSGELRHRGEPVTFADPRAAQAAGISTIYQELDLVPMQSAARNLYLGREPRTRLRLVDFARMRREANALLDDYQIRADVDVPLNTLGLGTQQMISVARAVALHANVVIMDEPTSSLESREVETLFGIIRRLRSEGVAIVYVSHRLDELYRICDTVSVLRDGRLVHTGPMAELPRVQLVATMLGRELQTALHRSAPGGGDRIVAGPPVLELRGLTRRNRLHDVSLEVHRGEVVGLGGLLGAGRSETGMAVLGAQELDSGAVLVEGKPIRTGSPGAAIEAGVALLPEDRKLEGILPNLSIRDNIAIAALPRMSRLGLVSDKRIDQLVEHFMARLHIRATGPGQKVSTLSGGNQQKVMLARWLCLSPRVLVLDEPTRGIDVGAKFEVRQTIDELAAEGLAVLLISSETEELVDESDRIVVLKDGAVVAVLDGDDISEHDLVQAIAAVPSPEEDPTRD
ncbi:MAG: sugar ABC transporter ATP-binding protein [Cellulomonas sp. 73-145]|uniref:sugar ABC transporter ATP-binding protein n=1 Tax=unclassified Cellulomonas TaxID=2620175 RepID=UPI0009268EE9|nr:sugar ABC transporter ATP-binding protein [Cellulomonas sp. 73-145]MBN9328568.1 sugar ABC transporter ATP-binding protein [Cellulomonas sp.]OJV58723.1 MAG: sugar ABC transporter ATP-binding protein [Cellulomonas sp. 73-145]